MVIECDAKDGDDDDDDCCDYTPESRLEMYREVAEEKQEKEDREKEMRPKKRNYEEEHDKVALVR